MPQTAYQFRVTLKEIEPPIWRRFQVRGDITFHELHLTLQVVMGWWNYHLYLFQVGPLVIIDRRTLAEIGGEEIPAHKNRLDKHVRREGMAFEYEYDYGDRWRHELVLEKVLPLEIPAVYPCCLAGGRACPPEDCGGIGGYEEFLCSIEDPAHPRHRRNLEWIGGGFDPEAFDLEHVTRQLREGVYWQGEMVAAPLTSRNSFTRAGQRFWDEIPEHIQANLISYCWCVLCQDGTTIYNFRGMIEKGNLRLLGQCIRCEGPVTLLIRGREDR